MFFLLFVFRLDILSSMLLDLANACCCFFFQTNQCGLGGEILVSSTLSSYVIGLKGHISSTNWLPIMQSVSL